jgi:hypothetical protein
MTLLETTMKTAPTLKTLKPSGIAILNAAILVVLTFVVSNKVSQDHKSEIDSAMRASNRLVRSVVTKRDLVKDQRLASNSSPLPESQVVYIHSTISCIARDE